MTITPAGTSALVMYRATRRRRRRRIALSVALFAAAGAIAAAAGTHGMHGMHGIALPTAAALAGAGVVCGASVRVGALRDADRWRRGAEGERRTAELLDALPSRAWAVWHDLRVPGSRANIDHLVVGRTGVWVVDTKSPRGRVTSGWRSVRLGEGGGRKLDTGPVRWEAVMVAERLQEVVGRPVAVRPLVAIHGASLGARGVRVGGVRVLGADRLTGRIRRGRRRVSRSDRRLLCQAVDETLT